MKRQSRIIRWIPAVLALLLVLGVMTVFSACGMKDDGTWMKCHGAQVMTARVGGIVAALLVAAGILKNKLARVCLYALSVVGCVVILLIPGTIMPMCMMRTMRCYTVMQPFVRIMAVVIAAVSGICAIRTIRER